ncbi:MAG: DUF2911 domain-containing protein [Cytophagales bacterium]|nr:DUF2911 domain-containing protein [Cytophagales bacterium]
MKKIYFTYALLILISTYSIYAQIETPAPSPFSSTTQKIGLVEAKVEYSRPSMKGRKIFGDLVSYDKFWRTGANAATKLTFTDTVMIEGKKIPAGSYGLFTIPSATEWTIIISKNTWLPGAEGPDMAADVVRFKVKPVAAAPAVETFTILFANLTRTSADLVLTWENTIVKFTIATDPDKKIMAAIKSAMESTAVYWTAANYYHDNDKDLKMALEWVNKVLEKEQKFWTVHLKAKIYKKMGDCKMATETAQKSKDLAIADKSDDYIKLNDKLMADCKGGK